MDQTVHLRYNINDKRYELTIPLKLEFVVVKIESHITVLCGESETVGFLIEQAKRAIEERICSKLGRKTYEVDIYLRRKRQDGYKIIPDDLFISVIMTQDHAKTRMKILGQEFRMMVNSPRITKLELTPVPYETFKVYPIRLEGLYLKPELCKFKWYKTINKHRPRNWLEVGDGPEYLITSAQNTYRLKCSVVPVSSDLKEGPMREAMTGTVMRKPVIPKCPFDHRHKYTKKKLAGQSYRVVCYNTLSSRYTHRDATYSNCETRYLVIDYRKQLILKEILGYNADIICLQEMDQREYKEYFKEKLEEQGFYTKFFPKGYYLSEGMMCAARKERFRLKSYEQIVFSHALKYKECFKELYKYLKSNDLMYRNVAKQCTSLMVSELKCQDNRRLLIGNVHMSCHPENAEVRLIHAFMAIRYLNHLKGNLEIKHKTHKINIILCGDFNSEPNTQVYKFITEGKLNPIEALKIGSYAMAFQHNTKFKSACGSPEFTLYTPARKYCVDYIFVEDDQTEIEKVVPFLEKQYENKFGMPYEKIPSDHFALVADIKYKTEAPEDKD